MKRFWILRRHSIPTQSIGAYLITPVVQSVGLRWPGGGWLWQFPLAVEVAEAEGSTQQRVPIPDPTRMVVWFLYALALVIIFTTVFGLGVRHKRKTQEKLKIGGNHV